MAATATLLDTTARPAMAGGAHVSVRLTTIMTVITTTLLGGRGGTG